MLFGNAILFLGFSCIFAQRAPQVQNVVLAVIDLDQGEYHGYGSVSITMLKAVETETTTPTPSFKPVTNDLFSLPTNMISHRPKANLTYAFNGTSNIKFHHTNTSFSSGIQGLTPTPTSQIVFSGFGTSLLPSLHYIAISFEILNLVAEAM